MATIDAMLFVYDRSELVIIPRSVSVSTVVIISSPLTNWGQVATETHCKYCDFV